MWQIKSIEELEPLLASQLARGYFINLNYELMPPCKPGAGENGESAENPPGYPPEASQKKDMCLPGSLGRRAFMVSTFHSRD